MDEFYSPVISENANCTYCNSCGNACPVKAIQYNGAKDMVVERVKCFKKFLESKECLECLNACKSGALSLKVFMVDGKTKLVEEV